MSKWARKKDLAHKPLVAELEQRGFVVFDCSGLANLGFDILNWRAFWPGGAPFTSADLMAAGKRLPEPEGRMLMWASSAIAMLERNGVWLPAEVKNPAHVLKAQKKKATPALTKSETKAQQRAPIPTATCIEDVLKYF